MGSVQMPAKGVGRLGTAESREDPGRTSLVLTQTSLRKSRHGIDLEDVSNVINLGTSGSGRRRNVSVRGRRSSQHRGTDKREAPRPRTHRKWASRGRYDDG
jgi:hypothetical protein